MTRKNNIHLAYLIVEAYNNKVGKPINQFLLIKFIKQKTGVTAKTANKYISELQNGIFIEGKKYQINFDGGGYVCQKKT